MKCPHCGKEHKTMTLEDALQKIEKLESELAIERAEQKPVLHYTPIFTMPTTTQTANGEFANKG